MSPIISAKEEGAPTVRTSRDTLSAVLSILPGLGRAYKGHYRVALVLCFVGVPVMFWVSALVSLATFGFGLVLLPAYWALVALNAYWEPDWRKGHHWLGI